MQACACSFVMQHLTICLWSSVVPVNSVLVLCHETWRVALWEFPFQLWELSTWPVDAPAPSLHGGGFCCLMDHAFPCLHLLPWWWSSGPIAVMYRFPPPHLNVASMQVCQCVHVPHACMHQISGTNQLTCTKPQQRSSFFGGYALKKRFVLCSLWWTRPWHLSLPSFTYSKPVVEAVAQTLTNKSTLKRMNISQFWLSGEIQTHATLVIWREFIV